MIFKRFRRFIRARARKQRLMEERQQRVAEMWERGKAEEEEQFRQWLDEPDFYAVRFALRLACVEAGPHEINAIRHHLRGQGWTPPANG